MNQYIGPSGMICDQFDLRILIIQTEFCNTIPECVDFDNMWIIKGVIEGPTWRIVKPDYQTLIHTKLYSESEET
jgi:hypothetical protein